MGALREPKLLKLEVRTPQNMVLYSKSATTSLSNLCYNCIENGGWHALTAPIWRQVQDSRLGSIEGCA